MCQQNNSIESSEGTGPFPNLKNDTMNKPANVIVLKFREVLWQRIIGAQNGTQDTKRQIRVVNNTKPILLTQ